MLMFKHTLRLYTIALIVFTAIIGSGCDGLLGSSNDQEHHDHLEPNGLVITDSDGQELARYESEVTGSLTVDAGSELGPLTVQFIAADGDLFQPDDPDYTLSWDSNDPDVATLSQSANQGKWIFTLTGVAAGDTEVRFLLIHSGEHEDFTSKPIPISVN
jgi:hypothetical protein